MPRTDDKLAVEPTLAERAADVIAHAADGPELAVLKTQRDPLATGASAPAAAAEHSSSTAPRSCQSALLSIRRILTQNHVFWAAEDDRSSLATVSTNVCAGIEEIGNDRECNQALRIDTQRRSSSGCASPLQPELAAEPAAPEPIIVITAATMIDGAGAESRARTSRSSFGAIGSSQSATATLRICRRARSTSTWVRRRCCRASSTPTRTSSCRARCRREGGYDVQLLKQSLSFRAARAVVSARRALEQGFTTLRDMGTEGAGYGDVGIKQAIEAGYIPGPRLFVCTLAISSTGGYPLENYAPELTLPKGVQLIDGPVEARQGRARATRQGRRLDQGVHDASVLDRSRR